MTRRGKWLFAGVSACFLGLILWTAWGNTALELNRYTVESARVPKSFDGYRIAHVSDLHNTEFGRENEGLLSLLREAEPDLIALTGDLIDSRNTQVDMALRFAEAAVRIAPCYYVTGNHESRVSEYTALKAGLTERGVTVLADDRAVLEREGQEILLLGVNDPTFSGEYALGDAGIMDKTLKTFQRDGTVFTVLLSHRPELFAVYADNGMDVVLSGHAHGGQYRLPLIGGVIAPHQGFFPEYDAGLYKEGETHMLVSRGIGNSLLPFRFNNRPEVLLVELKAVP